MKILKSDIKSELNLRTQKNWPKNGIEFIDINPLVIDKNNFKKIVDKLCDEIKDKNVDYIVAPEARGFLFAAPVAYNLNIGLVPIRKFGKMAPLTVEHTFESEKEYGKDMLELPKLIDEKYDGKRFYLIDDIYATGSTFESIKKIIEDLGGIVVGEAVVMNIKELNNNNAIYSIIDINES